MIGVVIKIWKTNDVDLTNRESVEDYMFEADQPDFEFYLPYASELDLKEVELGDNMKFENQGLIEYTEYMNDIPKDEKLIVYFAQVKGYYMDEDENDIEDFEQMITSPITLPNGTEIDNLVIGVRDKDDEWTEYNDMDVNFGIGNFRYIMEDSSRVSFDEIYIYDNGEINKLD